MLCARQVPVKYTWLLFDPISVIIYKLSFQLYFLQFCVYNAKFNGFGVFLCYSHLEK